MKYELTLKTEVYSKSDAGTRGGYAKIKDREIFSDAETAIAKFEQFANAMGPQIQGLRNGEVTEITIFRCNGEPVAMNVNNRTLIECTATLHAKEDSENCRWHKLKRMKLEVVTPRLPEAETDEDNGD